MLAKVTLIGMNEYDSNKLWEHFSMPSGYDEDLVKSVILENCGELPLLHPDLNYLSWRVGVFCKAHKWTFEKWLQLLNAEYDPLVNYDRTEEWTDETEHSESGSSTTAASSETDGTTTHQVSAYNETTFSDATHDIIHDEGSSGSETGTESSGDSKSKHKGTVKGNIGVTTSQAMWLAQADLARFNVYNDIARMFKREFCLGVYV